MSYQNYITLMSALTSKQVRSLNCCIIFIEQKRAASLVFGATKYEGLVQLKIDNGSAGLVCNDENSWDLTAASILCVQLFGTTAKSITSSVEAIITLFCITMLSRWVILCGMEQSWEEMSLVLAMKIVWVCARSMSILDHARSLLLWLVMVSLWDNDQYTHTHTHTASQPANPTAVYFTLTVPEGSVRLADGPTAYSGRVEVYANNTWGSVCDDGWSNKAGNVVCKQLGFSDAEAVYGAARYGTGTIWQHKCDRTFTYATTIGEGPVILDDVRCTGGESNLLSCNHNGISKQNCIPEEAASVACHCKLEWHSQLRLGWTTTLQVHIRNK